MGLMRLLLAIDVLLWHCPEGIIPRFLYPTLAVQCFYAVSGFLIQMVIRAKYQGHDKWQTRFYVSRILRIYPVYLLLLVLTILLIHDNRFSYFPGHHKWGAALLCMANNLFIAGQDVLRFIYLNTNTGKFTFLPADEAQRAVIYQHDIAMKMTVMGQSWTLAIELYFYLLAPILLVRSTAMMTMFVAASIALRFVLGYSFPSTPELLYGFFPTELAVFLCGALACRAYAYFFESGRLMRALRCVKAGKRGLSVLCVLIVAGVCWVYMTCDINFVSTYAPENLAFLNGAWGQGPLGAPTGYWLILLMTIAALPFAFHFSRTFPYDRFVGELSYPVYISHFLIMKLFMQYLHPVDDAKAYVVVFVLVSSIAASILLVEFIEKPIDRLRHRLALVGA